MLIGHAAAQAAIATAIESGTLHHAWLIVGPKGVGKGVFARAAALRILGGSGGGADTLDVPPGQSRTLFEAGTHPDFHLLEREAQNPDKPELGLRRSITVAQVRALAGRLTTKPALSARRAIVIDSADDLERPGASNALLKTLEEPPQGTVFLLVSHAPGRLLPTIRSRCRLLRLSALSEAEVEAVIRTEMPDIAPDELQALTRAADGAPGRSLRHGGMDMPALNEALSRIAREGDADNMAGIRLSKALGVKAAQPRYEAFLERVPTFIAEQAPYRTGAALREALDAYDEARRVAAAARDLSLDAAGTVVELSGIVARLARV